MQLGTAAQVLFATIAQHARQAPGALYAAVATMTLLQSCVSRPATATPRLIELAAAVPTLEFAAPEIRYEGAIEVPDT